MAQVIISYKATVTGGATIYWYQSASSSSTATRIYAGTRVTLPADYVNRLSGGMYPITDPGSGWMYAYNLTDLAPVYATTTDACAAPTSVALDTAARLLTIVGGGGGDLNELAGFGVSWRDRAVNDTAWGEWSADTVISVRTMTVEVGTAQVRQFRVRTRGSAGSGYFSDYVVCPTLLNGSISAGTPTILLPISGATARCHTPSIKLHCAADAQSDELTLMRSIDGGGWEELLTLSGAGGEVYDRLPELEDGAHTVRYKTVDTGGTESAIDAAAFTIETAGWTRPLETGTVISNAEVSHQADIRELLSAVNALRAFYGLIPVELPGVIGRLGDWQTQMLALQAAVERVDQVMCQDVRWWEDVPAYPTAAVVTELREAVSE